MIHYIICTESAICLGYTFYLQSEKIEMLEIIRGKVLRSKTVHLLMMKLLRLIIRHCWIPRNDDWKYKDGTMELVQVSEVERIIMCCTSLETRKGNRKVMYYLLR